MKKLILLAMMFWGVAYGQSTLYLRGDSVMLQRVNGNSELIILNGTRSVTNGLLQNIGNGRTRFVSLDSITTATLASNGLSLSGDTVQLGQNASADGKASIFNSARTVYTGSYDLNFIGDTASNRRYGNATLQSSPSTGAFWIMRGKYLAGMRMYTDSTTAFMGLSFFTGSTVIGAMGYDYRPGINLEHIYMADMRSTTKYASVEVNGASTAEFWADGHTILSGTGAVRRVNIGSYGIPGQNLKVNGSGRFTDSLYLDKIPLTTSLTNQYVLLLGTADSVVRRIHPDSLGGGGSGVTPDLQAVTDVGASTTNSLDGSYANGTWFLGTNTGEVIFDISNSSGSNSFFEATDAGEARVAIHSSGEPEIEIKTGVTYSHIKFLASTGNPLKTIEYKDDVGFRVYDLEVFTDTIGIDIMGLRKADSVWGRLAPSLLGGGGSGANTALSNLASVAINTTLLPGSNDGAGLGNASFSFSDLFLAEGAVINFDNGDLTLTQTGDALALAGGGFSVPAGTTGARTLTVGTATMYSPGTGILEGSEFWTIKATNARHLIGESSSSNLWGALAWDHTNNHLRLYHSTVGASDQIGIFGNGNVGIGVTAATGRLHLAAGTATASTGPLKFTSGTLTTAAEAGLNEYNGNFYATKVNDVRFGVGGSLHNNVTPDALTGTGEEDLMTYSLPAGTLSADGSYIEVRALFNFVTTGQTITLAFGGTDVVDFTATGIGNYYIEGTITRTGAATQMAYFKVVGDDNAVYITTPAETLSGAITLKGTGDGVGAGDITQYQLNVKYFPN